MSEMRRHWTARRSAYWGVVVYMSIDCLTSIHNWMLEHQDWSVLTTRDYSILSVSTLLSMFITLKALQSNSWHQNGKPSGQNANPQ